MGYVTKEDLRKVVDKYINNEYYNYIKNMLDK